MKTFYSDTRPQMHDFASRKLKGLRIIKTLGDFLGNKNLGKLKVLDVGSSTGIIDSVLATKFGEVWGIDIDKSGVDYAKKNFKFKNLHFEIGSALNLRFDENKFDVVICTHIYEHVSDPQKLFNEIYRVLKPGGVCYFAAINALWPIEPHYNLPFLSWLPKNLGNLYVRVLGKTDKYHENPMFYRQLKNLVKKFKIVDYTGIILTHPKKFGYQNPSIPAFAANCLKHIAPTFFWILIKNA